MGGVHKVNQPQNQGASISIAMSLTQGLGNAGGAQAFAGPNGAFAQAGGGCGCGGLGSFAGPQGPNGNALAGNFGGPQNPQQAGFQAGFQQGQKAAKIKRLMGKIRRLMSQMGGGMQGPGGPGFGGPGFGGPGFNPGFGGPRLF